jgi:hypothetical protein
MARGVYLFGSKLAQRVRAVQIVDCAGNSTTLRLKDYISQKIEPEYKTLPWQQNVALLLSTNEKPKKWGEGKICLRAMRRDCGEHCQAAAFAQGSARCAMTASDTMPTYKFKIGQTVFLSPSLGIPGGAYVVTRKLPEREGEFEYRVKSANEPHERVVQESQLSDA